MCTRFRDTKLFFATINRKAVCLVLVLLTISMVSLGFRIPWLAGISSSTPKPKARPRAIIETQIKTCKQIIKDIPTVVAVLQAAPSVATTIFPIQHAPLDSLILSSSAASVRKNSRAPPATV
jgi:short subunit fatty acids transporter